VPEFSHGRRYYLALILKMYLRHQQMSAALTPLSE
jgi:hypothetical protein